MINRMMFVRIFCVLLLLLSGVRGEMAEPAKKKLQIFILAGQSNMVGPFLLYHHPNPAYGKGTGSEEAGESGI